MDKSKLIEIAKGLVAPGKGILAADESTGSIDKKFASIGLPSTIENHRLYRQLLFSTPGIERFISGVIMFDETVRQKSDEGVLFPKFLTDRGIIPGIKVDRGFKDMANFPSEKIADGLDGLRERFQEYAEMGLKFAKFRTMTIIGDKIPTSTNVFSNAEVLARYAALAQEADIVPIVEPEIFMEGTHTLKRSKEVLETVLKCVFSALDNHRVYIPGIILKSSWVHPGLDGSKEVGSKRIAESTMEVFGKVLPGGLLGVVFLSGGDSPEDSTAHLDALNELHKGPWKLSFSFGRALQEPVLKGWLGKKENFEIAQKIFYERAELNSLATKGEY